MALTDNLAWGYEMDEASGNAIDVLGINNLTDTNTVTAGTGKVGGCRVFAPASGEQFVIGDRTAHSVGDVDYTILALVNMADKTDAGGGLHSIISKDNVGASREYHLIWIAGTDRFRFTVFGGASGASRTDREATSFGTPSLNTWYGIWAWHDSVGNTINIQVDGVSQGSVDSVAHTTGIYDGTADFEVGALITGNRFWSGSLDQLFGWKRVLSGAERTQIFNSGNWMSYAAMVGGGTKKVLVRKV